MGIGMFRRNYDDQPVAQVAPVSAPVVEAGEPAPVEAAGSVAISRSSNKNDLKVYLAELQGSELTAEQEAMTKAELTDLIFGSEA